MQPFNETVLPPGFQKISTVAVETSKAPRTPVPGESFSLKMTESANDNFKAAITVHGAMASLLIFPPSCPSFLPEGGHTFAHIARQGRTIMVRLLHPRRLH